MQVHFYGANLRMIFFEQLISFYTKIGFAASFNRDTRGRKTRVVVTKLAGPHGNYFKNIVIGERIKRGFKVMETVIAFAENIQPEIDFAVGKSDHAQNDLEKQWQ